MKSINEKYSVAWAKEKRETCKLCQRKERYGFCRRHAPRTVYKTYPLYNQEQLNQALSDERSRITEWVKHNDFTSLGRNVVRVEKLISFINQEIKEIK